MSSKLGRAEGGWAERKLATELTKKRQGLGLGRLWQSHSFVASHTHDHVFVISSDFILSNSWKTTKQGGTGASFIYLY